MSDTTTEPDFASNPPPLYPGAKRGRAIPGQTFEVDGVCIRRDKEIFRRLGVIDKGYGAGVGVFVSRWRGVTSIEVHGMERMGTTFSRSGAHVFLPVERIEELIELLHAAREFVASLPAPAKKRVAVRKQTKLNEKESIE